MERLKKNTFAITEEVDDYIAVLFDEYAESGDTAALMTSLRVVSCVKGVSLIAETSGLTRKDVQKALSENGTPQFGSVNAIMHAMGYRLTSQKLSSSIPESGVMHALSHSVNLKAGRPSGLGVSEKPGLRTGLNFGDRIRLKAKLDGVLRKIL